MPCVWAERAVSEYLLMVGEDTEGRSLAEKHASVGQIERELFASIDEDPTTTRKTAADSAKSTAVKVSPPMARSLGNVHACS